MTDDNSSEIVDITADYGAFKQEFNNPNKEAEQAAVENEEDTLATDEGTDAPEGDEHEESEEGSETDETPEADEHEEEHEEPQNKGKRGKPTAQQRINELTREKYEIQRAAEARVADMARRLEALEKAQKPVEQKQETPVDLPPGAPDPSKYPLGEYDPKFIFDLTQFSIDTKNAELEQRRQQNEQAQKIANAQRELATKYQERLSEYEQEVPEVREHIIDLMDTFATIEPSYGEYLATTIMECDNGPAIMDYLSQNIGEAQNIVASGPAAATRAIGRLEAKLSAVARPADDEKRNTRTSVSPPPPTAVNRGSGKGRAPVRPDTDDYKAFKRDFLSKL